MECSSRRDSDVTEKSRPKPQRKLLRCRARSEDFGRKLNPRFVLSDNLYVTNSSASSDISALMKLPFEILGLVFEAVDCAPSQIALALSCKRMAVVARDLDLKLSMFSAKYAGFLPRAIFDVPGLMKQLRTWMPDRLRLCDHCLTNRPASKEYWANIEGCEMSNFWITKTGWNFANASWHKQVHNICPACHVTCSLSDHLDCDGCRALGRMGDIDWSRISDHWRRLNPEEAPPNVWDLTG